MEVLFILGISCSVIGGCIIVWGLGTRKYDAKKEEIEEIKEKLLKELGYED